MHNFLVPLSQCLIQFFSPLKQLFSTVSNHQRSESNQWCLNGKNSPNSPGFLNASAYFFNFCIFHSTNFDWLCYCLWWTRVKNTQLCHDSRRSLHHLKFACTAFQLAADYSHYSNAHIFPFSKSQDQSTHYQLDLHPEIQLKILHGTPLIPRFQISLPRLNQG